MEQLIQVYKCLCDPTRLRILNLLQRSPLCVCHVQLVLDISQVNASRHLGYLRKADLLDTTRHQNWTLYSLTQTPSPELERNLACLQDLAPELPEFRKDLQVLEELLQNASVQELLTDSGCPLPTPSKVHEHE